MSKKNLFVNIAYLLSSNIFTQGLRVGRGFIVAKFLGPELMGIWAALFVYLLYGENLHLGVYNSLSRDIPIFRGQENNAMIKRYFNNAFTFTVFSSILAFFVLFIISHFTSSSNQIMDKGMKFMPFLIFTQQWIVFFKFSFLARNKMKEISKYQATYSILSFLSAFLIITFGFMGQMFGLLLVDIVYLLLLVLFSGQKYKICRDNAWITMMKSGFPIYLVGLVFVVLMSLNRIIIVKMLGTTALGHFSLAFLVFSFLYFIPESIRIVLYVRMGESYGSAGQDREKLRKFLSVGTKLLSIIMPFVVFAMSVMLMFFVPIVLPKYVVGIKPTILYMCSVLFLSFSVIYSNYLNIISKQTFFLFAQFIAIIIHIGGALLLINNGYGLNGISIACILAYFIYYLLMHIVSMLLLREKWRSIFKTFFLSLLPMFFMLALYILLQANIQEPLFLISFRNVTLIMLVSFLYGLFAFFSCYFNSEIRILFDMDKYINRFKAKGRI
ncbi:MAG: polysaccharide biosynthesis C-terminal domain-containing protein [Candidatus Omnitrophica bacterium]|nr:polysaccharide biosynthesis C-terminal domain-containing protein [Candidatus Omnitrophota bacterium]